MTTLKTLAATALRGTARADLPPPGDTALEQALARVPADSPETLLLGRAALAGLHARAGAPLVPADTPPLPTLPPADRPVPLSLWPLLPPLLVSVAAEQTLADVAARNWTLCAAQALTLYRQSAGLAPVLWPLLDARGQAVLDTHPMHAAWQKADAEARWQAQLAALREHRHSEPAAGAARTLALWQEVKVEARRDLIDLLEHHLLPDDLPLLEQASKDRSAEVQARARMLRGHLPGPLQDEVRALVAQVTVKGKKGKLTFKPFNLPEPLGKVRAGAYDDSDVHRLLGALPFPLLLDALGMTHDELTVAAGYLPWHLKSQLERQAHRSPAGADAGEAEATPTTVMPDSTSTPSPPERVAELLRLIQQGEDSGPLRDELDDWTRQLDPDTRIPPPGPLPFVLPPRPPKLPSWQAPAAWEEGQVEQHRQREAQAEAAWRELTETLRLRGEWQRALEAVP